MRPGLDGDSRTAWISQGFERLVQRVRDAPADTHFDILIIGSGYGGAVAAATFAGRQKDGKEISVGVLERGMEYLPGAFPTGLAELPRHIRRAHHKEGLFDIRLGRDVTTVIANGVGGGSLINAGVMEVPLPSVFRSRWPSQLAELSSWKPFFDTAAELLGGRVNGLPNTIVEHVDGLPQKFKSVRDLAPADRFRPAAITVAMADSKSSGNVQLNKCVRCGDCATGCNFGAKNSLDVNLLVRAHQHGAEIFSGATVLSLEKEGDEGWIVNAVYTDTNLRKRDGEVLRIRAAKIVLAAGTLGSSEILLRSRELGLSVSDKLGKNCSTNGDMLVTDYATAMSVNTVADEAVTPSQRAIGPTITGVIDLRDSAGVLIEEMSVPAGLRLAFTEVFATINALHRLDDIDWSIHRRDFPIDDAVASKRRTDCSALYAVMGDDGAAGEIRLAGESDDDGVAKISWLGLQDLPLFDGQVGAVAGLTKDSGGRVIANPVWKLLPKKLSWLLKDKRGPLTTVHPLGGCGMADSGVDGVVDHLGRVFTGSASSAVHDGLVVLDGSIVPTALGTNPALTISAIALRAAEALAVDWGYDQEPQHLPEQMPPLVRPVFRDTDAAASPSRTEVEIIERLVGPVQLKTRDGTTGSYVAELTLRFCPKPLSDLTPGDGGDAALEVATDQSDLLARSAIRIFPRDRWEILEKSWEPAAAREQALDAIVEFSAPLTGTLKVLRQEKSRVLGRIWRSGTSWLLNRGLRDIYQAIVYGDGGSGPFSRIRSGIAVASRSGALRSLTYELRIGTPDVGTRIELDDNSITGTKTFTYNRRCNPWRQLMEVKLDRFPGLRGTERVLNLDLSYLARIGVPLFRVTDQRDGVSALGDMASFLGYFLRLLLLQHIWSFRAPDKDIDPANDIIDFHPPKKLALPDGGSVEAEIISIPIPTTRPNLGKQPVAGEVLVTRYPQRGGTSKRPVVMLHGYSAGGTTFAHHAVNPNMASYLWATGRDIWIADLRTSPAHDTANKPWSFDEIGKEDVRLVIERAAAYSIDGQVDVVAHCMGTITFSIAVLADKVSGLVNRAAFTQVGPLVVFTPANIFRAYVVRYLLNFLPDAYDFNPPHPTLADDLWDRVLSTLPYPVEEFDVENPLIPWKRTPWTRTRHRMDALYGRDFNVANMEPEMLRFINEHFGALSLKTVATTLHFVRYSLMTSYLGRNDLVSRRKFEELWNFPAFSVHGAENGLTHVSTVDRMRQILTDAGRIYVEPFINPGAGHQDSLIGTTRHATFRRIEQFLDADFPNNMMKADAELCAYPPWIGPILTEESPASDESTTPALILRLGSLPSLRAAEGVCMLRIQLVGDDIQRPDGLPWDLEYIVGHMVHYWSSKLKTSRWDAFEAPPAAMMPGEGPRGNALLVLLVYAEDSRLLTDKHRFYAFAKFDKIMNLDPQDPRATQTEETAVDLPRFRRMAQAVLTALSLPQLRPTSEDLSAQSKQRLHFLGLGTASTFKLDRTQGSVVIDEAATVMEFGQDSALGKVVRERFVEADRFLLDGVVPYDPPSAASPEPLAGGTSFSLSSCQYPAGFIDNPVAYRSYRRIVEHIEGGSGIKPRFMLFTGDQVYVDPTAGLYDPTTADDRYRLPYETWLGQTAVRDVLRRVPSFMLLDDHEIDDNWEPVSDPDEEQNQIDMKLGVAAFEKYQRGSALKLEDFRFDGFDFFMLDTRTQRTHRKVGRLADAHLVAPGTMRRLKDWLGKTAAPKFIISPSMLLPRHRRAIQRDARLDPANLSALHSDGWDGYPNTLREVLGYIAAKSIPNVVFLSGDEHRGCIAAARLFDEAGRLLTTVHSIHTAAMYAPYPFANGIDEEIVASETIAFTHDGRDYRCVIEATRPPEGDGATFFRVYQDGADWQLDCEFADGVTRTVTL